MTTTGAGRTARGRLLVLLLAALAALAALLLPAAPASAANNPAAEKGVGAIHLQTIFTVGVHESIRAGQHPVRGPSQRYLVSGHCVAAEAETAGVSEYETVPYRPSNTPLENHHGVLDVWAKNNIEGYVSRAADNPTMALSQANHEATTVVYRDWLTQMTGRPVGGKVDWTMVGPREVQQLANDMFTAAGAPQDAIDAYYSAFNRYIYGVAP